jgi:hypothetical protein
MGGPACTLWIPHGTHSVAEVAADRMIRAVEITSTEDDSVITNDPRGRRARRRQEGVRRRAQALRVGDFYVQDTRAIGGRLHESGSPLYCSPPREHEWRDEVAEVEVLDAFGFQPDPIGWSLGAYVNSDDAHRQLAELAAHLAEQTGGVIDFCTYLPAATALPGIVRVVGGYTGRPRRTLLDSVALRAWANHPGCWMCK